MLPHSPRAENAKINVTNEPYSCTYILCNYLPFSLAAKGAQGGPQQHKTPKQKHSPTDISKRLRSSQNNMDCIYMTPLHCLFALSLFWWPEPLENVSGWVSIFKSLGPSNTTFEPLAAFRAEGQIIAHFLWRSYDLHIYYGIFCTGCSVGGRQRPISPQVWTKAWQRYFQCRQCSLLSSLVIQIPMVTAMGGWVNNLGLFPKKQIGGGMCVCGLPNVFLHTQKWHLVDPVWIIFLHSSLVVNEKYAVSTKAQFS